MEGKNRMEQGNVLDGLHEECGVFGMYDKSSVSMILTGET